MINITTLHYSYRAGARKNKYLQGDDFRDKISGLDKTLFNNKIKELKKFLTEIKNQTANNYLSQKLSQSRSK